MSDGPKIIRASTIGGAAQSYVESEFGGPTTEREYTKALNTSAAVKLTDNNPDRVSLLIMNLGAYNCYLGLSYSVTDLFGILLNTNGGFISLSVIEDQMLPTREWYGISTGGPGHLYIMELFRYSYTYSPVVI